MGIRGLTTYMNINSHLYLRNYELHDTYLVIDGNSVAAQLYSQGIKCNNCFGGDYDKYANYISTFFDDLIKCNITPLIIIDGGREDKKLSTMYKRMKAKIQVASIANPERQSRTSLFPLFLMDVFKNVVQKNDLKLCQSLFEADNHIASVARILNCPVLSSDSDFFIFDVMYIPFNTLFYGTVRIGDKFVKSCKIYKQDYFLESYPDMDKTVIPVAAILLGNDYIDKKVFQYFLSTLKRNKRNVKKYNEYQQEIDAIFTWLQKETLDSSIKTILSKIDPENRKNVLEVIEMIINGYFNTTPIMLHSFGFSSKFLSSLNKITCKVYKFENIDNLKIIQSINDSSLNYNKNYDLFTENLINRVAPENESYFYKLVPTWFIKEFNNAKLPSYFINILTEQVYMCPVQVEDFSQPTCINISLKIIAVIFNLLTSEIIKNKSNLEYIARGKSIGITSKELVCENRLSDNLPSLFQLSNLPLIKRKQILNQTLGLTNGLLDKFPSEWKLYIGVIKYWVQEAEAQFRTKCHIYSLLFAMLFHVVDRNIGFFCRKYLKFEKKYGDVVNNLSQNRKIMSNSSINDMSIHEALINVSKEDCLLVMPFFLSNFNIDKRLVKNSKKFSVTVVHAFSLFQNCLRHSMNLNALLDFPYQDTNVAELLNGTLLYNLYNNFKHRQDIDKYISTILQNSPSLLQLFTSILMSVQILFSIGLDCQVNYRKRIRHRKKQNNNLVLEDDNISDKEDLQNFIPFYDILFKDTTHITKN